MKTIIMVLETLHLHHDQFDSLDMHIFIYAREIRKVSLTQKLDGFYKKTGGLLNHCSLMCYVG